MLAVLVATAALVAPSAGMPSPDASRPCTTLVSIPWTRTADGRVSHGRRYRVESERIPCFIVTRLAAQLIPLRTRTAFESARPVGYVCIALGAGLNPYRPRTAVGTCFQKPVATPPPRSFSWRPVSS